GLIWKHQRCFGIGALRKLGMGNKGMERGIQTEVRYLVEFFRDTEGRAVDPSFPIVHAVSNVTCAVVFGHRFCPEDETFQQLMEAYSCVVAFGNSYSYFVFELFPWFATHFLASTKQAISRLNFVNALLAKEIESHKERGKRDENQDFIDYYLDEIGDVFGFCVPYLRTKGDADATYDEENLMQSIFYLFLAGTETTATTLCWALLYMVLYPDIQEKVQKELDAVLGCSHFICYEERRKLPYTNSVIHEIQRYSNIILISLPRQSLRDTELLGFPVPKNTMILANTDFILSDPEKWETPDQFNPGRFLDKDGNFVNREAFLPFSIGHRVCMGELLARMELFIIISTLLKAFKFTLLKGVKEINTKLVFGSTMKP
ncbi:Cytochrome P450 2J2, partial [Chaetura pelagica]